MTILQTWLVIIMLSGFWFPVCAGTVTRTVQLPDDVTRIYLNGANELHLTQGDTQFVRLTAPEDLVSQVKARIKGKSLYLGREKNWNSGSFGITSSTADASVRFDVQLKHIDAIRILGSGKAYTGDLVGDRMRIIMFGSGKTVTKSIMARDLRVECSGSCDFQSDRIVAGEIGFRIGGSGRIDIVRLDTDALDIDIAGSGNIKLEKLITAKLDTKISGSANLELAGRVRSQDLEINGSADYKSSRLISDNAYVDIRGAGDVTVSVQEQLTAELTKGADLVFYGGPALEADISGQGKSRNAGKISGN